MKDATVTALDYKLEKKKKFGAEFEQSSDFDRTATCIQNRTLSFLFVFT